VAGPRRAQRSGLGFRPGRTMVLGDAAAAWAARHVGAGMLNCMRAGEQPREGRGEVLYKVRVPNTCWQIAWHLGGRGLVSCERMVCASPARGTDGWCAHEGRVPYRSWYVELCACW